MQYLTFQFNSSANIFNFNLFQFNSTANILQGCLAKSTRATLRVPFLNPIPTMGEGGCDSPHPPCYSWIFLKCIYGMNIPEKSFWYCKDLSSWVRFVGSKVCPILNSTNVHVLHIVGLHSIKSIFCAYNMQKANVDFAKVDQFSTPSFKNDEISKKIMTSSKIFMSNGS